ncbi:uncharacterized protein BDZ99DRAFT_504061 [Mytilinidion resinicola]|uniref:ABM domain-containing protein n=1 Tax=Mytilinidion resinicola TaxID=574789 RepID=A0A6A6Y3G9_9PEZI|nr:uncharacterized protein BDZ99DRAFT_504061 [Mytilinidion resinicola]KAF2802327.1 hypothetical protein BDZ99DRAFT_504061 [Mytilinidion resinicola]
MSSNVALHVRMKLQPGKRDGLIEILRPIEKKAREDPGTLAYFIAIPAQGDDGTQIAMFEIYEDLAACDAHAALPEVDPLRKSLPDLLAEKPLSLRCKPFGKGFIRSGISEEAADAGLTIMIRMTWAEGTDMAQVESNFEDLIAHSETEPQTFAYHYATSDETPNTLYAFEQFESGQFCMETHMKSDQFIKTQSYASDALTPDPLFAKRVLGFSRK